MLLNIPLLLFFKSISIINHYIINTLQRAILFQFINLGKQLYVV